MAYSALDTPVDFNHFNVSGVAARASLFKAMQLFPCSIHESNLLFNESALTSPSSDNSTVNLRERRIHVRSKSRILFEYSTASCKILISSR